MPAGHSLILDVHLWTVAVHLNTRGFSKEVGLGGCAEKGWVGVDAAFTFGELADPCPELRAAGLHAAAEAHFLCRVCAWVDAHLADRAHLR